MSIEDRTIEIDGQKFHSFWLSPPPIPPLTPKQKYRYQRHIERYQRRYDITRALTKGEVGYFNGFAIFTRNHEQLS